MKKTLLAAACSFDLSASIDDHFVIIPEGIFTGIDGRPFDAPHWELTPERGRAIVAVLNQRQIDMVIDYEHATLRIQTDNEPAPAAGWLKPSGFTYIEGIGICSTQFEWTDKAKNYIEAQEYKYISPVFLYDNQGNVLSLLHVALTNTPNLDQLPEAKLAAAAQDFITQTTQTPQDSTMDELLERLRWMLNLPVSADANDILAELDKLKNRIEAGTDIKLAENAQNLFDAVQAFTTKLAANNSEPNPALFVPMAVYQDALQQSAQVAANNQKQEVEQLITAACSDGRLTGESTIAWAKAFGEKDPDGLKAHLDHIPKIAALNQRQTQTLNLADNNQRPVQHDDTTLSIASQLGLDAKDLGANT
ncbi:phage protease [Acinetobacter sp. B5B]|uniref:phage protease n=1 Tax=Acinetobacter baretiae TaxID=2605383 RepID=UPI0018C278F2|nr:phage protease [Acinetobacter baretiae]MBF7683921.1 phage protease [Acinetobacter baretiae]